MATKAAVANALKLLKANFAGDVTDEKAKLWYAALRDVSDEQLGRAIPEVIKTHRGEFIPPVAVVRDAAGANQPLELDVEAVLDDIRRLGSYNPVTGWSAPKVATVAHQLGAAIGEAYGVAGGGSRLFAAEGSTTVEIATRDFQKALTNAARVQRVPEEYRIGAPAESTALPAGEQPKALKPGAAE